MRAANQVGAMLEIGRLPDGKVPTELISAAYLASRSAIVVLVLDSVSRAEVDNALDSVVAANSLTLPGVLYADVDDDATILPIAARAPFVVATSDAFRAKLSAHGIKFRESRNAENELLAILS